MGTESHIVSLMGDARTRGRAQAAPANGEVETVRRVIEGRIAQAGALATDPEALRYLDQAMDYARVVAPQSVAEAEGIAEGYGLAPQQVFLFLHLAILADRAQVARGDVVRSRRDPQAADGCSAWAALGATGGSWIGKNRDFRGEHRAIQRLFLHHDPTWGARRILCVGSLGAPGAYSSGINSDGLALADTQIATSDHGIGLCRYFLMTEILARCATVSEALDLIASMKHAGGGSLVLGDGNGGRAAVELGHSRVAVEQPEDAGPVARTNHFTDPTLAHATLVRAEEPMVGSSEQRLATLRTALGALPQDNLVAWTAITMASHDDGQRTGLCRHGQDGDATTISSALFATDHLSLYFCEGNPCRGQWRQSSL